MLELPGEQLELPGLDTPVNQVGITFVGTPTQELERMLANGYRVGETMEATGTGTTTEYRASSSTIAAQNWLENNWPMLGMALGALVILSVVTRK
jgi:hypothetical protein